MKTACVTNVGGKNTNQDSLLVVQADTSTGPVLLAMVCDGMGGLQKGELASAVVIRAFDHWFQTDFPIMVGRGFTPEELFGEWNRLIQESNRDLILCGKKYGIQIGTTVSGIMIFRNQYYIINVGDSRVYEITDAGIRCLTKDHSLVMREVEQGRLSPEEMEHDRRRNVLLQCIGATGEVKPDFFLGDASPRKVYMICCDGFRHEISAKEFYEILCPGKQPDQKALQGHLQQLIDMNIQRGERDNITAIGIIADGQ